MRRVDGDTARGVSVDLAAVTAVRKRRAQSGEALLAVEVLVDSEWITVLYDAPTVDAWDACYEALLVEWDASRTPEAAPDPPAVPLVPDPAWKDRM